MSISQTTPPPALAGFVHNSLQPDLQQAPPPPPHATTTARSDRALTTSTAHASGTHTARVAATPKAATPLDHTNGAQLGTLLTAQEQTRPAAVTFANSPYATVK